MIKDYKIVFLKGKAEDKTDPDQEIAWFEYCCSLWLCVTTKYTKITLQTYLKKPNHKKKQQWFISWEYALSISLDTDSILELRLETIKITKPSYFLTKYTRGDYIMNDNYGVKLIPQMIHKDNQHTH